MPTLRHPLLPGQKPLPNTYENERYDKGEDAKIVNVVELIHSPEGVVASQKVRGWPHTFLLSFRSVCHIDILSDALLTASFFSR